MDVATYAVEAAVEETHWWFVGRRFLFSREIVLLDLPSDARVLDVGTSTGTNLRMLREAGFRAVTGLDLSEEFIRWCAAKGLPPVQLGDVCALPFADGSFDLVLATDVFEHVEDDARAASEVFRVLKPGGYALVTVPTFRSLWGLQDDVAQHKRRYRLGPLLQLIRSTGLETLRAYYFNYILFAPIWLGRRLIALMNIKLQSENNINSPFVNRILIAIFKVDVTWAARLNVPYGVSALVMARKPV